MTVLRSLWRSLQDETSTNPDGKAVQSVLAHTVHPAMWVTKYLSPK